MIQISVQERPLAIQHYLRTAEDELIARALTVLEKRIKDGPILSFPSEVRNYLRLKLGREDREVFGVIWLDAEMKFLAEEALFVGSISECSVQPREIVKSALANCAVAALLFHNHPSGGQHVKPSSQDDRLTKNIQHALGVIDVRLIDHIIVSTMGSFSYSETGLI